MTDTLKPDEYPQDIWDTASDEALKYVEWLMPAPTEYRAAEYVLTVSFARVLTAERQACSQIADDFRHDNPFPTMMGAIATAIRNR